jgi:hypothetical protein
VHGPFLKHRLRPLRSTREHGRPPTIAACSCGCLQQPRDAAPAACLGRRVTCILVFRNRPGCLRLRCCGGNRSGNRRAVRLEAHRSLCLRTLAAPWTDLNGSGLSLPNLEHAHRLARASRRDVGDRRRLLLLVWPGDVVAADRPTAEDARARVAAGFRRALALSPAPAPLRAQPLRGSTPRGPRGGRPVRAPDQKRRHHGPAGCSRLCGPYAQPSANSRP